MTTTHDPDDYSTEERTAALKAARAVVGRDALPEDLVKIAIWIMTGEDPWALEELFEADEPDEAAKEGPQ